MKPLVLCIAAAAVALTVSPAAPAGQPTQFVLSPEGNNLWAYDAATGKSQLVVQAVNGTPLAGVTAPPGSDRRDINGQVCVAPDGRHVITGEDTVLGGGDSHDPRIAGWGWFEISGSELGAIALRQQGKLAPEGAGGPGYAGDPDNYGCAFLDADRLLTTAIGNTLPGEPANGQLFLWFGPFDRGFRTEKTKEGDGFFFGDVPHCVIDSTLATAGGIAVDAEGDVYVAANRFDDQRNPGAVWRYHGAFPSSAAECTPKYVSDQIVKQLVVPTNRNLPVGLRSTTPSAVAIGPKGTLYVSSVFSGVVSEFDTKGAWIRDVYPLSPLTVPTGPTGNTPFGLTFASDGSLWIADLGIVLNDAADGQGSVIRVKFDASGAPTPLGQTVAMGLNFPDGLGVYTPQG